MDWDPDKIDPDALCPYPGYKHYHLHMPQVKDGYAYLAYSGYGLIILDVKDPARPKYVGSLKTDPPFSDFISCHTALPNLTCFNGGIRVYDTSDVFHLREIAYYIPADPQKDAWPIPPMMNDGQVISRCEDVLVDDRGYIYMTDSNGGLSILRCLV